MVKETKVKISCYFPFKVKVCYILALITCYLVHATPTCGILSKQQIKREFHKVQSIRYMESLTKFKAAEKRRESHCSKQRSRASITAANKEEKQMRRENKTFKSSI